MSDHPNILPVVSKIFCSPCKVTLTVRKRPHVTNGGGFAVMNFSQQVLFSVNGCGVLGTDEVLIVRDDNGEAILFIRKKAGIFQALRTHTLWKGHLMDHGGVGSSVFSLKEHRSCLLGRRSNNAVTRISTDPNGKGWDFEVKGSFVRKACTIIDRNGDVVAQVMEVEDMMLRNDLYEILVQPGYDQAFIIGIIAVLDSIYSESTRC